MPELINYVDEYIIKAFLVWGITILFSGTFLMLIVIIFHKIYIERRKKALSSLIEGYRAALKSEVPPRIDKPRRALEYEALTDVVIDLMDEPGREKKRDLKAFARECRLPEHYQRSLKSGNRLKKLVAIESLGLLRLAELKPFFKSLLEKALSEKRKDEEMLARIVLALGLVADSRDDLAVINRALLDPQFRSSKFKEYLYTRIVASFAAAGKEPVLEQIIEGLAEDTSLPLHLKKDIIGACGLAGMSGAVGPIKKCFGHFKNSPLMRISCIRALGALSPAHAYELISAHPFDEDWRVRAIYARAFTGWEYFYDNYRVRPIVVNAEKPESARERVLRPGAHPGVAEREKELSAVRERYAGNIFRILNEYLHDKHYFVRMNAARSLASLGREGLKVLTDNLQSTDRFTRELAHFMLKEVQINA